MSVVVCEALVLLTQCLQVRESVTRNTRLIKVDGKTSGTDIPGLGNWAIPDGVTVSSDVGGGDG